MIFTGGEKRSLGIEFIRRYHNKPIYVGIPIDDQQIPILRTIGFQTIEDGVTLLPAPIGKKTDFNANGREIIHKDQPKETVFHMVEWDHEEWRGRDTERVAGYVYRPYKRYPRTREIPPGKELSIFMNQRSKLVISEKLSINGHGSEEALYYINLFLEIFGKCHIFDENLEIDITHLKKVNWKILPAGTFSHEDIEPIISNLKESVKKVIWYRIDVIKRKNPEFIAIGQGGFKGYIVFAFPPRQIFVLESIFEGNATYVFDGNWEALSKRTKMEILSENLQKDRFIHRKNWVRYINHLLR